VNFFGHTMVAGWWREDEEFVLGAMLPDLCAMARLSLEHVPPGALGEGVTLHHRTDAAFHYARPFLTLCAEGVAALQERGVPRGSARAAAHIGIELALDGILSDDAAGTQRYRRGLLALGSPVRGDLAFRGEQTKERLTMLLHRLTHAPIPESYRDPAFVAVRIAGALAPRPRLALGDQEAAAVRAFMPRLQRSVALHADALMQAVRDALTEEA
jgi:hypothetical protein